MDVEDFDRNVVIPPIKYEYLDHTADVQLHSWGGTLKEAFEQCAVAMFGYMTELDTVDIELCYKVEAHSQDLHGLLYKFLDELLYMFSAEPYLICKKVEIIEFDLENFSIECFCWGESFVYGKHPQGTEVKAITYSAMSIVQEGPRGKFECFVIVDV